MMKNLLSDWKGLKLSGVDTSCHNNDFDLGVFNLRESSAALCRQQQTPANTSSSSTASSSVWGQKSTSPSSSVWGSPQSPSSSIGTQYFSNSSHSNSKESLWASTQSSPTSYSNANNISSLNNTNNKELANLNNNTNANKNNNINIGTFLKNNNNVINLWENPISKLSQASLMQCKEPLGSIWSPQKSVDQNTTTKTIITTDPSFRLLRPHDIVSDTWNSSNQNTSNSSHHTSNNSVISHAVKHTNSYAAAANTLVTAGGSVNLFNTKILAKEPVGSLWAKPTPPPPGTNYLSTNPLKLNTMASLLNSSVSSSSTVSSNMSINNVSPSQVSQQHVPLNTSVGSSLLNGSSQFGTTPSAAAASSCLQLFSDEFLNYLNMIN